ncbi:GNAT family N-acetyltransferase [Frankia sp. CN6]|uniref:GNAT family N-acetyltransferase n=2 Tax=Frankia nepalensis TaxID=1836974 RepID=A0A937RBS9_9ACTN|nr:GNAT family N-acetyltransferase [Frankia nepalensis]
MIESWAAVPPAGLLPRRIIVDDLTGPEVAAFLREHIDEMRAVTPPHSKHALDLPGLRVPEVTFWTMLEGDTIVATGALKALDAEHAEVKSMRTHPARKRQGIATLMLEHLLAEARRMGFRRLSLETGSFAFFAPARALYARHGFEARGPFGDYQEDPNSVYLTRTI